MLIEAAMHGDRDMAQDALRRGADANANYRGWPALFWAAQEGHTPIVSLLLDAGANVHFADTGGFTPLKQAIGESHLDTAALLLLRGADIGYRCHSDSGTTVLHTAAAYGLLDCIRLLLRHGADRNAVDDDNKTPYDAAIEYGQLEAAALLQ
jgi:uncharacterized protein